jgi:hypothetical protein
MADQRDGIQDGWQKLIPRMATLTPEQYARVSMMVENEGAAVFDAIDAITRPAPPEEALNG